MAEIPINSEVHDIMQRILEATQNLQRRVFRESIRSTMNERGAGMMRYDAESILRDVNDLVALTDQPPKSPEA